jgi:hypothetical protein
MVTPPYSPAFFFSGIPVPPRFAKVFHDVVAPIDMSNDRRYPGAWSHEAPNHIPRWEVNHSKKKLTDSQEALRRGRKRRIIF